MDELEVTCPECDRSAVRPGFTTCDDCASDLDRALILFDALRTLYLEATANGILTDDTVGMLLEGTLHDDASTFESMDRTDVRAFQKLIADAVGRAGGR